jgi:signal peptidase I
MSLSKKASPSKPVRNSVAEWAVTILLLLFGTATVAQPYVIPSGSMEDTLLVGDHLIVDKLAYAPSGTLSKSVLPYQEPRHGDIIVFRYPPDRRTRRSSKNCEWRRISQRRQAKRTVRVPQIRLQPGAR